MEVTHDLGEEELVTRYQCEIIRNGIVKRLDDIDGRLNSIDNRLEAIWSTIGGRPSWAVLVIITLLSSLVVGLTVLVLK